MTVLLDTRTVEPEHRREAWAAVLTRALFPLAIDFVDDARSFVGQSAAHEIGSMALVRVRGTPCMVRRTLRTIHAGDPGQMVLATVLKGHLLVEQDDRQVLLAPGELTTWTSSRPFFVPHRDVFDLLLLSVPEAEVRTRTVATAGRISGTGGIGALGRRLMVESWRQLSDRAVAGDDPDLQDALLAITRSVCGGGRPRMVVELPDLARRVRSYAERHLDDPRLTPSALASAHHVSLRRLHAAFAADGQTPAAWIRHRRLERCYEALSDPEHDHVPIGAIAERWGLSNPSHFSRAFRELYGLSPRELRERHGDA